MPLHRHDGGEQVLTQAGSAEDVRLHADPAWTVQDLAPDSTGTRAARGRTKRTPPAPAAVEPDPGPDVDQDPAEVPPDEDR